MREIKTKVFIENKTRNKRVQLQARSGVGDLA